MRIQEKGMTSSRPIIIKPTLTEWMERNLKEAGNWTVVEKAMMVMIYKKIKSGEFRGL